MYGMVWKVCDGGGALADFTTAEEPTCARRFPGAGCGYAQGHKNNNNNQSRRQTVPDPCGAALLALGGGQEKKMSWRGGQPVAAVQTVAHTRGWWWPLQTRLPPCPSKCAGFFFLRAREAQHFEKHSSSYNNNIHHFLLGGRLFEHIVPFHLR